MTKNLTLILALLLSLNIIECRASNSLILNDIITSNNNNEITKPYNKAVRKRQESIESMDTMDGSFDNELIKFQNSTNTNIEGTLSSIKNTLDNINTNIKNISDRQQNDRQIKFNKEIEEAYETFWNETKEFNNTYSNGFIDPEIAKRIKNNSSGIGSFFNIVDDPVKGLANFALTKGLEFYQSQTEAVAAKTFLDLNNTDSVSSYSNVQTKFYEIYDKFANSIKNCVSEYKNIEFNNKTLQNIWEQYYEPLLISSVEFSPQLESCINQLQRMRLFTSIEAINKYINIKELLEPIIKRFTKEISLIDTKGHTYTREIYQAYQNLSNLLYKTIFPPQSGSKYKIDDLQYVWTMLIMKYYTKIINTLKQLHDSFPNDKVIEKFKTNYPIFTIRAIANKCQ